MAKQNEINKLLAAFLLVHAITWVKVNQISQDAWVFKKNFLSSTIWDQPQVSSSIRLEVMTVGRQSQKWGWCDLCGLYYFFV